MKTNTENTAKILIGNSFPFTLIRREVSVKPISLEAFTENLPNAVIYSFWGHSGTLQAAKEFLGISVAPETERPAITLTADGFPTLYGEVFDTCYVCSPIYVEEFRPKIGEEVPSEKIKGWQLLQLQWK